MDRARYQQIRARLNLGRSWQALPIHLSLDAMLVGASVFLWSLASPARFVASLFMAVLFFRNFGLMHDAVHGAVLKNKFWNDIVGFWSGMVCFLPYWTWRKSHLEHHYWAGNIEKDPVMALVVGYPRFPQPLKVFLTFFWKLWFPVLTVIQLSVFWLLSVKALAGQGLKGRMVLSVVLPFVFWGAVVALVPLSFVWVVLVPGVVLYMLAIEVVNFPHHLQLPQHGGETKLAVWDQHEIARSCVYPTWFARLVVLNFNYHAEHHMFPEVPWYRLDQLHEELQRELAGSLHVDPSFKWIRENKPRTLGQVLGPG